MPTPEELEKEKEEKAKAETDKKEKEALALAEAKKAEEEKEHMIPKSRFDEVNTRLKESEKRSAALEKEKAAATEKHLEEQGKFQELAEERGEKLVAVQQKADEVESMEKTLSGVLEAQTATIPEAMRELIPSEYTTQQKLNWLAENSEQLMKPNAPDLKAGKRGGEGTKSAALTDKQREMANNMNISEEDYAKNIKE